MWTVSFKSLMWYLVAIKFSVANYYCHCFCCYHHQHYPHNLLLHKLTNFRLSSGYVSWFHSYLINRQSFVCISGAFSCSFVEKYGVPHRSSLAHLLFNISINDICDSVLNLKYLPSADDLKIYHSINNIHGCKLLWSDTDSVQNWHFENGMILNADKTTIISFMPKTISLTLQQL
jgi:hypothetical protein